MKDTVDDNLGRRRGNRQNDSEGKKLDVTSPIGVSGAFIQLAEAGRLPAISPLMAKHQRIGTRLAVIEEKLRRCNVPESVNEYASYCKDRRKEFSVEFRKLVKDLEARKTELRRKLRVIEKQLSREQPSLGQPLTQQAYLTPTGQISLVPTRQVPSDPDIVGRNNFISAHRSLPASEICGKLDGKFIQSDGTTRGLPVKWVEDFEVRTFRQAYRHKKCRGLVQTLVSKAKKSSYLPS
jgi:hypothetical protein